MKCSICGADSTFMQRRAQLGKCPSCQKPFAFEPKSGHPLSDVGWKAAIDWVSSNGTVAFTLSNLHHAVARRVKPKSQQGAGVGLCVLGVVLLLASPAAASGVAFLAVFGLLLVAAGGGILYTGRKGPGLRLDGSTFMDLYRRWVQAHGVPPKLIEPSPTSQALSAEVAEELESYSFDRAVFCDRPDTVDLLLANDFHFENNCAVLTANGYPRHAFPIVRKMLKQNPRLEVFVLHDATPAGCVLAHLLKTDREWFGGTDVPVYDVALRPAQAEKQTALLWPSDNKLVASHPAYTEQERAWLSKHWMAVAALGPEQIIKRLFRAIHRMPELAAEAGSQQVASDSGGGNGGGTIFLWTSDAHASDGGGDSFG